MAKLTGKKKEEFLKRMAKGRADAKKNKKKSSSRKTKKSTKSSMKNRVKPSRTKRNRGGSASDLADAKKLLLAIKDPKIKEIIIRK